MAYFGVMVARAGVEVHGSRVVRAAIAAHSTATAECLRAIRAAQRASHEQRTAEVSRLRRHSEPPSGVDAERRLKRLRPRELEVTLLLARGLHTNEVARVLFISELTVRTHVKQALRHCRVHSRAEVFRLFELAQDSDTVRLASRRVQPPLAKWWSRADPGDAHVSGPEVTPSHGV